MSDTIVKVLSYAYDLEESLKKTYLDTFLVTQDNEAHQFDITLLRNKVQLALPSGTVISAYFIRYSDNATISLTGKASGSMVSVTLKKACYNKGGQFALVIKAAIDGVVNTVFYGEGTMLVSITDTILDEENVVPSLSDLLAQIAVMEDATKAANTATTNANNATTNANGAAAKINGMTVSATSTTTTAGATISEKNGVKHIAFALPKGDKGDKGDTGSIENLSINGKPVESGNITLGASDVGALPNSDNTWTHMLNMVYPVGSIYMSVNSASPATLFGGTWEQLKDRFLLGAGDSYEAGITGGAASVALTLNQLPKVEGTISFRGGVTPGSFRPTGGIFSDTTNTQTSKGLTVSQNDATEAKTKLAFGNDEAHENMPPYLAVYIWKRVS